MTIHKEGYKILSLSAVALITLSLFLNWIFPGTLQFSTPVSGILFLLVLQFFRNPSRVIPQEDNHIVYAPADGKVVVIETVEEPEHFHAKRIQVSIFMSPLNVHVNRNPIAGKVTYLKHHPGKYLVAWHPKSSTENERTTVVLRNGNEELLIRQIAGAMAKRIKNYLHVGDEVEQGSEMGFITFGSRVDVFLPLDAKMEVSIGQAVKGNLSVIARLPEKVKV